MKKTPAQMPKVPNPFTVPERYQRSAVGRSTEGWEQLNVAKLARDVGYSAGYLRAALTGKKLCSMSVLCMIAEVLATTPEELMTYVFAMRPNPAVAKGRKRLRKVRRAA